MIISSYVKTVWAYLVMS